MIVELADRPCLRPKGARLQGRLGNQRRDRAHQCLDNRRSYAWFTAAALLLGPRNAAMHGACVRALYRRRNVAFDVACMHAIYVRVLGLSAEAVAMPLLPALQKDADCDPGGEGCIPSGTWTQRYGNVNCHIQSQSQFTANAPSERRHAVTYSVATPSRPATGRTVLRSAAAPHDRVHYDDNNDYDDNDNNDYDDSAIGSSCYCYCGVAQAIGKCYDMSINATAAQCSVRVAWFSEAESAALGRYRVGYCLLPRNRLLDLQKRSDRRQRVVPSGLSGVSAGAVLAWLMRCAWNRHGTHLVGQLECDRCWLWNRLLGSTATISPAPAQPLTAE